MTNKITKTLIAASVLGCFTLANADTIKAEYPEISFTMKDKALLKTNTAEVYVTINTTSFKSDKQQDKLESIKMLQSIFENVTWKVTSYTQKESASGAMNTTTIVESRLTQAQISKLRQVITDHHKDQKITIQVANFTPTDENIQSTEQELMINMYNNIKKYVTNLNNKTDTQYRIQDVKYNVQQGSYNNNRQPRLMMYAKEASNDQSSTNVEVTNEINLSAYIKLADKTKP